VYQALIFTTYKNLAKTNCKFCTRFIKIFRVYFANRYNNFFDDSSVTKMEDLIIQIRIKFNIGEVDVNWLTA